MTTATSDWSQANTSHGMLVAFGEFLNQYRLIGKMMQVPVDQKTRKFSPQTKLVEFLTGILSGMEHLRDLNDGAQPVAKDGVVARAWGQAGFAHYSGVSRTLEACDEATVAAVEEVVDEFSQPFIAMAVHDLLRRGAPIVFDFDLTGQAVSSTSTSYPEAAFGWMNDSVKLGYQLARVCLSGAKGERVWLAGFHHPGDTVSSKCLKELVEAAEAQAHIRPRRRTEKVQERVAAQEASVARTRRLLDQQQAKAGCLRQTRQELFGKIYHTEQMQKGPLSGKRRAVLQKKLQSWRKRLPRLEAQSAQAERTIGTHQSQLHEQLTSLTQLLAWQTQLEKENQTNPDPPPYVEVRMDAGFVSGENLTSWLVERVMASMSVSPESTATVYMPRTPRYSRAAATPTSRPAATPASTPSSTSGVAAWSCRRAT